jgi:hypothetical protein
MGPFAAVGLTWNSVVKAEVVGSSKLSANIPEPVKELAMNLDVFTNGGTLTVGQIGAGVTTLAPIGQFNGYIDEIRMWTRPNNPSIVKNNWRKDVSEKTPDLFAAWSFSEGTGYLSVWTSCGQLWKI